MMAAGEAASALALAEEAVVSLVGGGDALHDPYFYLCGRLLAPRRPVAIPSFAAAISGVWRFKERVLIREEMAGVFVFQFKTQEEKDHVLHGGPWFFSGSMLVMADYDGIGSVEDISLQSLELWVAVTGLRVAMRNERALTLIGNDLGALVKVDTVALKRKDPVQRIRIVHDVRRRIWARRTYCFSPELSVLLEFRYEKCHGICPECGWFGHGGGACDKGLLSMSQPDLSLGSQASETAVEGAVFPGTEAVTDRPEVHFCGLSRIPLRNMIAKTIDKLVTWSSGVKLLTSISSTYTSMIVPMTSTNMELTSR